jgi:hypothetical protein
MSRVERAGIPPVGTSPGIQHQSIFSRAFFFQDHSAIFTVMVRLPTVALFILLSASSISISSEAPGKLKHNPSLAIIDSGSWKAIHKGVEFRKMTLERSEPNHSIDLKLLRFDMQSVVPRVLRSAQFQLKGASAKTFAEKSGAIATINASYFDTDGKPLAFLKVAPADQFAGRQELSLHWRLQRQKPAAFDFSS